MQSTKSPGGSAAQSHSVCPVPVSTGGHAPNYACKPGSLAVLYDPRCGTGSLFRLYRDCRDVKDAHRCQKHGEEGTNNHQFAASLSDESFGGRPCCCQTFSTLRLDEQSCWIDLCLPARARFRGHNCLASGETVGRAMLRQLLWKFQRKAFRPS